MILADFHTHTDFSTDCTIPMEDMIKKAVAAGLKYYCITDHMDYLYDSKDPSCFTFDSFTYAAKVAELKDKFKDQIEIRLGIELGLRNETEIKEEVKSYYETLLSSYPFDFVIGSTHQLMYGDPYEKDFWTGRSIPDVLSAYFFSITENACFYKDFDVYGHLDYIVRYLPCERKEYVVSDYVDLIDELLKTLISKGKGIECNTSGYFYGLCTPHPKAEVLKRYKELGGEILTIGSDAHRLVQPGYDFSKASDLLKSLGFKYYTIYKARKPEFLLL